MSSKICKNYFHYFYLVGLGHYNPRERTYLTSSFHIVRKSVPSLFFLLFTILNMVLAFQQYSRQSSLTNFLYTIFVVLKSVTAFVAFKRSSFLRNDNIFVWKHLQNLEQFLKNRLKIDINFRKLSKRYKEKLFYILLFFSCWIIVKIIYRFRSEKGFIRQIAVVNLTLITVGVNCHVIFYIDLFTYFMETINQRIVKFSDSDQANVFVIFENQPNVNCKVPYVLRMVKLTHFKLWKIVRILNDDVGSVLTVLIINSSYTSVLTFYWIITDLQDNYWSTELHIMSMYFFFEKQTFLDCFQAEQLN